ncbi:MAG: sugar phosphate isomerase/epimerase [Firmicutes bacterium]|jgi:sugar phosphate isomerase/epimerase|nr:sugar phosphate isomerase/epimerase [Bacillota bacterium]
MSQRIGLAIAPETALPSAFVVFRDRLEVSIEKAARLGYDGIELALLDRSQVDIERIKKLLNEYNLELPVVSTGQIYGQSALCFTDPDEGRRNQAIAQFKGLMEVAAEFGAMINIGRVRGPYFAYISREEAEDNFLRAMEELAQLGQKLGVDILLEPVNRYEIDFVNSCAQGAEILDRLGYDNVKLMPDLFHMNIEEPSIEGSLRKYIDYIGYIHFADSNRHAPGRGHLDFESIFTTLTALQYNGFITVEILPYPEPDIAAKEAVEFLRKYC